MPDTAERLRISMADIALLARVKRPVVSVWRSRAAGSDRPFPEPIDSIHGQSRFDAAAVAEWLNETARGNNPTTVEDVAAFATMAGESHRDTREAFDALTALLCLKVISGAPLRGLDRDDLLNLAEEADPDDELLYSELQEAGERLASLATYADLLADAAYSAKDAFEKLMSDRRRSAVPEQRAAIVSDSVLSLAAKLAVSLSLQIETAPVVVDPLSGSSDLLIAVVREYGDRGPLEVMTASGGPAATLRLTRRRLRVHDVYREDLAIGEGGSFEVAKPVTHLAQLPTPEAPAMSNLEILQAIDSIVVQMSSDQRGVVIAPASALSDGFADRTVESARAGILRAGHVRAVVRLPKGLVPARSRQALAVWVLGAAQHEVEQADRLTMVADLANSELSAAVIEGLVTDLTAAAGGRSLVRGHAFQFARPVPTRVLTAARRSLVELNPGPPSGVRRDAVALAQRVDQISTTLSEVAPTTFPRVLAGVSPGSPKREVSTLGAALDSPHLRVYAGNRLDGGDLDATHGVRVIGPAQLVGDSEMGSHMIDRLVLASRYDAARLTEPGDVVFCTSPRPAAVIDHKGSSVVAYPARVLRIDQSDPGGLLAEVLAADINAQPARSREWRLWSIRRVTDNQRSLLSRTLAELRRARRALHERLDAVHELEGLITEGVTSAALTLPPNDDPMEGR